MDDKLVNWTHWHEELPSYARKCIIISSHVNILGIHVAKIFTDEGIIEKVRHNRLIKM